MNSNKYNNSKPPQNTKQQQPSKNTNQTPQQPKPSKNERKKILKEKNLERKNKKQIELEKLSNEINELERRIQEEAPERGSNPLANKLDDGKKKSKNESGKALSQSPFFQELPLSNITKKGLREGKFEKMTDIQRASIPHSLAGRDILGAARTGSGKTLAFLIPLLETLYRNRWTPQDGIGAIVLSPTRELAIQIFDVLRIVGKHHSFSAGLIIGGKDVDGEKKKINSMNILIATPGRLLQHMDETEGFICSGVQMLVLDEADRILDLGFSNTLNNIVQNLPSTRQTLLFSATQTKSIKDLARLSLREPEYVSVYQRDMMSTPENLQQTVIVTPVETKIDLLYSFVHSHLTSKTIVFLSTCKQVRYAYETFFKINPGCRLFQLHGNMKQWTRLEVFKQFCNNDEGTLFATDVAARGLDFPGIDWVVQMDCPDDIKTYIHRVGRTARYNSEGKAMLVLDPSEKKFLEYMDKQSIKYQVMETNPTKSESIQDKLTGILAEDVNIKYLGQKSFVTYIKSVFRQEDKEVFDIHALNLKAYAKSLGLPGAPKIEFARTVKKNINQPYKLTEINELEQEKKEKKEKKAKKNGQDIENFEEDDDEDSGVESQDIESSDDDDENEDDKPNSKKQLSKVDKLFKRKNVGVLSQNFDKMRDKQIDQEDDDDVFVLKRKDHGLDDIPSTKSDKKSTSESSDEEDEDEEEQDQDSDEEQEKEGKVELKKRQLRRLEKIKRNIINPYVSSIDISKSEEMPTSDNLPKEYLKKLKQQVDENDSSDKLVQKDKLKRRRDKLKQLKKKENGDDNGKDRFVAYCGGEDDDEDGDNGSDDDGSYDGDNSQDESDQEMDSYQEDDDDDEEEEEKIVPTKQSKPIPSLLTKRTLDDQEDLALQILMKKKRSNN